MRALTVAPGVPGARLDELAEPPEVDGSVLIETLLVGICATDVEIALGTFPAKPVTNNERLVLGHESLGRVVSAPAGSELHPGQLVVGVVRHPDPGPCAACAAGQVDLCLTGDYTEHGIQGRHGFARDRWRTDPNQLVPVPATLGDSAVLLEPLSVVVKVWDQLDALWRRARWAPRTALIIGAGTLGQFAALLATVRGLDVHVTDTTTSGVKAELVAALGAGYHTSPIPQLQPDIVIDCSGDARAAHAALHAAAPSSTVALLGVTLHDGTPGDLAALNRTLVLENRVLFGSVNANRDHYLTGVGVLQDADPSWLRGLLSRYVPLADFPSALRRRSDDVKVALRFAP